MRAVVAAVLVACAAPKPVEAPPAVPAEPAERPLEDPILLYRGTPTTIAADGKDVYIVDDDGHVWRVKRDGSKKKQSVVASDDNNRVTTIAVDADFVYVLGTDALVRHRKDGRGEGKVLAELIDPGTLVLGERDVFFSAGDMIQRVPKDGSREAVEIVVDEYPYDMLVVGDELWWSTGDYGSIMSVSVDGGSTKPVVEDLSLPTRMVTDGTHVYWLDPSAGVIARVPRGGNKPREAEIVLQVPGADDLAVDEQDVYWSDADAGTINRIPKRGGQPYTLFWRLDRPTRLVMDEVGVTYIHAGPGVVIRRPKAVQKNIRRAISK